eukprot:6689722-Alexandrium_andersonii.AAC.1
MSASARRSAQAGLVSSGSHTMAAALLQMPHPTPRPCRLGCLPTLLTGTAPGRSLAGAPLAPLA